MHFLLTEQLKRQSKTLLNAYAKKSLNKSNLICYKIVELQPTKYSVDLPRYKENRKLIFCEMFYGFVVIFTPEKQKRQTSNNVTHYYLWCGQGRRQKNFQGRRRRQRKNMTEK